MRKVLLCLLLSISFSTMAATSSFKDNAKELLGKYANVDAVDWYSKGDTSFADSEGFMLSVYRNLKASVRDDELNVKMQFITGPKRPDSNEFSRNTSIICHAVIARLVYPEINKKPASWDDEDTRDDALNFMLNSNLDDYNVFNQKLSKTVNGWNVSIYRIAMLTTCSAKKV